MRGLYKLFSILALLKICSSFSDMDKYLKLGQGQDTGSKSTNCSCGWSNKARIVGGKETLPNEFPLIAGIKTKMFHDIFCGGTIITQQHVLTAAHCTRPAKEIPLYVVLGKHDQTKENEKGIQVIDVEKVIEHENYFPKMFSNDISLLVLSKKIDFTQTVGPACLPAKRTSLINEYIKVLGWGKLGTHAASSSLLMKVNLRVVPLQHCVKMYPKKVIPLDDQKQICTFAKKRDSCGGDSGGPLIWLDPETNRYTLVALVSYGKVKCGAGFPAVNTDVSAYLDWIHEKIAASKPEMRTCSKNG